MRLYSKVCLTLILLLAHTGANALFGAPKSDLWPVWDAGDSDSTATIDHSAWQSLLDEYLIDDHPSGVNLFDYAAVTKAGNRRLDAYIDQLTGLDPRDYNRRAQEAYWVNLYNAVTVDLVLKHYPVESIREIHGGLLNTGPWDREIVDIAGEALTLNDIEHRILRPIYQDPRIHYAVNCASIGCPNLAASAYTGARMEEMLEQGARTYINHPRGARLENGRLQLSSIYDWFTADFGGGEEGVLDHLIEHAEPGLADRLQAFGGAIDYDYDWSVNAPDPS